MSVKDGLQGPGFDILNAVLAKQPRDPQPVARRIQECAGAVDNQGAFDGDVVDTFGAAKLPFGDPFRSDVAVANAVVPQQISGPFRPAVTLIGMGLIADAGLIAVGRSKTGRGALKAGLTG